MARHGGHESGESDEDGDSGDHTGLSRKNVGVRSGRARVGQTRERETGGGGGREEEDLLKG